MIGVPGKYGESWFGLQVALRSAGLTESDVKITEIGYTQPDDVVKAIDTVAHTLGKETIAEQVENLGSVAVLRALGVEFGQGYALGEPKPGTPPAADA